MVGCQSATPARCFDHGVLQQPDRDVLRSLMDYFEYSARDHLVTFSDFNELIILKPIAMKNGVWDKSQELSELQKFKHYAQSCGFSRLIVGGHFSGENGLRRSWQTAKATLSMVKRLKLKHQFIFHDDYALASLLGGLSGSWQADELSKIWRDLVVQDVKGVMQKTLQHYFEHNCDLPQTATSLHIHINTQRYRLQRVEDVTGIQINKLKQLIWLYIGMELQR